MSQSLWVRRILASCAFLAASILSPAFSFAQELPAEGDTPAAETPATETPAADAAGDQETPPADAPMTDVVPEVPETGGTEPAVDPSIDIQESETRQIDPAAKAKFQEAVAAARAASPDWANAAKLAIEAAQIHARATQTDNFIEAYDLASKALFYAKDYEGASQLLSVITKVAPNSPEPFMLLGISYFHLKEYNLAIDMLTEAISLNSQNPTALYWRGKARMEIRDFQAAVEDLQSAMGLNRRDKGILAALGKAHLQLGNYAAAKPILERAVKLDTADATSKFAEAHYERGRFHLGSGDIEKAVLDLVVAADRDPENQEYQMTLGAARLQQKEYLAAIEAFKKAATLKAKDADEDDPNLMPQFAVAQAYIEQGKHAADTKSAHDAYNEAIAAANEAIKDEPKSPQGFALRGVAQRLMGDYEAATVSLSEAIRLNPNFSNALFRRAIVWYYQGEYLLAEQDLDDALRAEPGNSTYLIWRGLAQSRLKKPIAAIESYSEAIRVNPRSPRAYQNRGLAFTAVGEHEKAVVDFNHALRIDEKDAMTHYYRGVSLQRLGRHEDAAKSFEIAKKLKK